MAQLRYLGVFDVATLPGGRRQRQSVRGTRTYCIALISDADQMAAHDVVDSLGARFGELPTSESRLRLSRSAHGVLGLVFLADRQVTNSTDEHLNFVLGAINGRASQIRCYLKREKPLPAPKDTMLRVPLEIQDGSAWSAHLY